MAKCKERRKRRRLARQQKRMARAEAKKRRQSRRKERRSRLESKWSGKERDWEEKLVHANRRILSILTLIGILAILAIGLWAYQKGLFTSQEAMRAFVESFGLLAPLAFIVLQLIQCIVPIIPGGITLIIGVYLFGPLLGFVYNYIGIVIGEVCCFLLARYLGRVFVRSMVKESTYKKYSAWMDRNEGKVKKIFVWTMLLPGMPDDLICMLAGLSSMSFFFFFVNLLWTKPPAILGYSLFLDWIVETGQKLLKSF